MKHVCNLIYCNALNKFNYALIIQEKKKGTGSVQIKGRIQGEREHYILIRDTKCYFQLISHLEKSE